MKKAICILYIICIFLLSGCTSIYTSYRELEDLHLIQTMGVDEKDGEVTLSIASGKSNNVKATSMARSGDSISNAIRALQSFSVSEDLFYSHIRYCAIGEQTAMNGISRVLDFVERAGQIRMDIGLFVVRGSEAAKLIEKTAGQSDTTEILDSLERAARRSGESYVFSARDIARALIERQCALISAIELQPTEGVVFSDTGEQTAVPIGYGLIKGDSLQGYIAGDAARGVALLLSKGGIGQVSVDIGRQVVLDVRADGCEYKPHWEGERLASLDITVKLGCAIGELAHPLPQLTEADYHRMEQAMSATAKAWIQDVLLAQQIYEGDYLGLRDYIRAKSPAEFAAAEADWPAAMADTQYNINIETTIRRDYDLHAPES